MIITQPPNNFIFDSNPTRRFSYSFLCRETNSFSTSLGYGGFGHVLSTFLAGKPPPSNSWTPLHLSKGSTSTTMNCSSLPGTFASRHLRFHNGTVFSVSILLWQRSKTLGLRGSRQTTGWKLRFWGCESDGASIFEEQFPEELRLQVWSRVAHRVVSVQDGRSVKATILMGEN
ncbi:hypothetical protein PIB30_034254 [Stylosanthes scabra]|uniref:Uncharacterized protein n=1 Tax=Stylosanthes scabra TaxID=79078 RepID=A0ABU6WB68_9FABA|nr:hypothetical protein [Stylosanthes scabra]